MEDTPPGGQGSDQTEPEPPVVPFICLHGYPLEVRAGARLAWPVVGDLDLGGATGLGHGHDDLTTGVAATAVANSVGEHLGGQERQDLTLIVGAAGVLLDPPPRHGGHL